MRFGEKLKFIRLQRDWSQEEMAKFLGTSKQVISRYENGQTTPKIDVVFNYAKKLNIAVEPLIDNDKDFKDLRNSNDVSANQPLAAEEETLLQLYRSLPLEKQRLVLDMVKVALLSK